MDSSWGREPLWYLSNKPKIWSHIGMAGTIHLFDFIATPSELPGGICPIFGNDRFLQNLAVNTIRSKFGDEIVQLDASTCDWPDVVDELHSSSLFDFGARKMLLLDNADSFVKSRRSQLEQLQSGGLDSVLLLIVTAWASNTKLYKQIDKSGLQIHCDAPIIKRGRGKQRDDAKVIKWLCDRAKSEYEFELPTSCAPVIIELTECNFGRMDQELAKLSLYAEGGEALSPLRVKKIVGGWPAQTMWTAIDAALEGRAGHAIEMLHQLFAAGEHPLAMFGQISWSLRRYAQVGELVARDSRNKRRVNLSDSLKQAGFRAWGNEMDSAGARLKQLGRERVKKLLDWIIETDYALKRSHSREDRGRMKLEQLFVRMAEELGPQTAKTS